MKTVKVVLVMMFKVISLAYCLLLTVSAYGQSISTEVRVVPIDEVEWTTEIRTGIESFGITVDNATNLHRVLENHA